MTTPTRISDQDIARIREANPIADVARLFTELATGDDGRMRGCCPLHEETSPSFHVIPERGMWYCFGCTTGGDVITLMERVYGTGFTDAVERLALRAGIEIGATS